MLEKFDVIDGWSRLCWIEDGKPCHPDEIAVVVPDPSDQCKKVRSTLRIHSYDLKWRVTKLVPGDCLCFFFLPGSSPLGDCIAVIFGVVYGISESMLIVELGLSEEDCCRYIDELRFTLFEQDKELNGREFYPE